MSLFSLPVIQTDLWELTGMSRIGRAPTSTLLQHELHRQTGGQRYTGSGIELILYKKLNLFEQLIKVCLPYVPSTLIQTKISFDKYSNVHPYLSKMFGHFGIKICYCQTQGKVFRLGVDFVLPLSQEQQEEPSTKIYQNTRNCSVWLRLKLNNKMG